MPAAIAAQPGLAQLERFLFAARPRGTRWLTAVSLFSGGGLSDTGYLKAGFDLAVQAELDPARAAVGKGNFPESTWVLGDIRTTAPKVVRTAKQRVKGRLDLLVATPPCQGMSSSNPTRGKRRAPGPKRNEQRNSLLLQIIRVARRLKPRVIVAENVRQVLTLRAKRRGQRRTVVEWLESELPGYKFWKTVVDVADYGVPQVRRRAVIVGVDRAETWCSTLEKKSLAPWPAQTHNEGGRDNYAPWVTIRQWLDRRGYPTLDAASPASARTQSPLHRVPHYDEARYRLIADIPASSGRSAYENSTCPNCGKTSVPRDRGSCDRCRAPMWNRPIVRNGKRARLIKGFKSSYRRMRADRPAATVMTNSSHVGSDFKIHPFENRVLSARECADLQTVPRWYKWSVALRMKRNYLVREIIGEALPPYFTFLHGRLLARLLRGRRVRWSDFASAP